jgi:outer membrane protein TolC
MNSTILIATYLTFVASVATGAESIETQTLNIRFDDLSGLLRAGNGELRASQLGVQAAKSREGQSAYTYLPEVEISSGLGGAKASPVASPLRPYHGLEATIPLYDGGRLDAADRKSELVTAAIQAEQDLNFAEGLATARDLYWRIVFHRDNAEFLKDALKLNKSSLREAQRRIRSGLASSSDQIEFEMQEANLNQEIEENDLQLANLSRELRNLLGLDPNRQLTFPDSLDHDHDWQAKIKHDEKDLNFLLKADDLAIAEREAEVNLESRKSYPRVDAFVEWQTALERDESGKRTQDYDSSVGLRLTLDLRDRLTSSRETQALRMDAQAQRVRRQFKQRSLEAELANSINTLRFIHGRLHQAEENVKRAQRYYQLTQSEYSRGVKNSPDMLSAASNLYETKQKRLALVRDFQLTMARLMARKAPK